MLAARRVIRVVPAVTRRALSSAGQGASSSSSSGISAPMLLAGTGVAMGVAAIAASGVVGGGADADAKGSPQLEELTKRLTQLEVDFAGKTNSAFVFVKPHACNKAVIELVKEKLNAAGIRITSEGELSASKIDKDMLIDTHYGAIASKAVKLKPAELNVPAKGQADFQKMFGMSWEDALKKGVVYNAADACTKLGVDASGLDAKWSKLARGTSLLKFGGGFYCGKVDDIYVINGFYMSMRAAYTTPPATLHYFTVQWPTDSLSWSDFRSNVLGATNPAEAAVGSVRREILEKFTELGLASKPNTGENGVHASASPFEALAERINWTGATISSDPFGRGMLAAGVPAETIKAWADDPQVSLGGQRGSLFDLLEDVDADTVLSMSAKIKPA